MVLPSKNCKMSVRYSKNCILMGNLDYYCLVCSTHLLTDEDVLAHIQESKHKAGIKSLGYFENYEDDLIRKVEDIYFCELCNVVISTLLTVHIHVVGKSHLKRKKKQFERVGTSIVFQNKFLIAESAWNGFIDGDCVLCNAEVDDYSKHTTESSHIFNVFRSKVIVDDNYNIYRKVLSFDCQCLICNTLVSDDVIEEHLKSSQHKNAFVKYDESQNGNSADENEEDEEGNVASGGDPETKTTYNLSTRSDEETLYTKPEPMQDKNKLSPKIAQSLLLAQRFARQEGLTINKKFCPVYCETCSCRVTATVNNIKLHLLGDKHQENLTKHSDANEPSIKKKIFKEFALNYRYVDTPDEQKYVIINHTICIAYVDFIGLTRYKDKVVCQFCHIDLHRTKIKDHVKSASHKNLVKNCFVIYSLQNEFVRQIKSDIYQCGFCAVVTNEFEDMVDHLATIEHRSHKQESENMLQYFNYQQVFTRRKEERDLCKSFEIIDFD